MFCEFYNSFYNYHNVYCLFLFASVAKRILEIINHATYINIVTLNEILLTFLLLSNSNKKKNYKILLLF